MEWKELTGIKWNCKINNITNINVQSSWKATQVKRVKFEFGSVPYGEFNARTFGLKY